jgi:hypothetical protein
MKMAKDMLREKLAKYIPPKEEWTPVDEALYGVEDIYNVPEDKAKKLRGDAIRYSFKHHYEGNKFYHEYCKDRGVGPDDIKSEEDFKKIPLIPDTFFKSYPDIEKDRGKDFLEWLEKIYTGKFPKIELNKKKPNYDDVIEAFWKEKVWLNFSTSTSGRFTFLLKDYLTYQRVEFGIGYYLVKFLVSSYLNLETLEPFTPEKRGFLITLPNPLKTFHTAKIAEGFLINAFKENEKIFLADLPVTTDLMRISLGKAKGLKEKIILAASALSQKAFVSKCIKYSKKWEEEGKKPTIFGFPFGILPIISSMDKKGIKFNFGGGTGVYTVGGWKASGGEGAISPKDFRKKLKENFGILEENCRDFYGMTELNAFPAECECHYKHIPYFIQPYVLDEEMNPLPYGEEGRFAFIDPLANSYPGFIMTGDRVKLLEHCPECSRPGPVLAPEIERIGGEPAKGCAAAMAKVISEIGE